MAEAINPGINRYSNYYNQILSQLQQSQGPERTDAQMKNYLVSLMRPTYDAAIRQRQQQTGQANAAIDADAASRGMGTSTWVTDAKNRQLTNEAADVANLNSNYNSALYEALLSQLNQRDQNRMNLMSMAQGITGNMYNDWRAEDPANATGGGGGIDAKEYYRSLQPHSQPHRNGAGGTNGLTDANYGLTTNAKTALNSANDVSMTRYRDYADQEERRAKARK